MSKKKLSMKEVMQIPPQTLLRIINKAKKIVKQDPAMISAFKEYSLDIDEIDYIPTYFKKLDVSAKTDHAVVWLSYKLLLDGLCLKDVSYLVHEYTHYIQQTGGTKPTQSSDDGNYLDNPYEEEAFQNQVSYIDDHFGEEEAEEYVDNLLEHHEVEPEKVEDKKEVLMAKV